MDTCCFCDQQLVRGAETIVRWCEDITGRDMAAHERCYREVETKIALMEIRRKAEHGGSCFNIESQEG